VGIQREGMYLLKTIIKAMLVGRNVVEMAGEMPNIKAPTMGGKVFWHDLESKNGYRLQKNVFSGHCRILNDNNERIAWGGEGELRRRFVECEDRGFGY